MPKRQPKKAGPRQPKKAVPQRSSVRKPADLAAGLRAVLAGQKKTELVDLLLELARDDRGLFRQLTARFEVPAAPDALAAATRQAIADATNFDERDINRNFDYDYEAYGEVKRNFSRLIQSGELRLAMELSLELMKQGSYQVEMSDEGLMTQDIEECLAKILQALKKCGLPPREVTAWCAEMLKRDRVGCICQRELETLRDHFETLRPQ
jgi:hypothetical protein